MPGHIKSAANHGHALLLKPLPLSFHTLAPRIFACALFLADRGRARFQILEFLFQPVVCHPYFEYWVIPCSWSSLQTIRRSPC